MNGFDSRQRQEILSLPLLLFGFWDAHFDVQGSGCRPGGGGRDGAEHLHAYRIGLTSDSSEQHSNAIRKARGTQKSHISSSHFRSELLESFVSVTKKVMNQTTLSRIRAPACKRLFFLNTSALRKRLMHSFVCLFIAK